MDELIINVALTGCVHHKAENPALPISPDEVATDARRCWDAGATMFHIHARDEYGNPAWGKGIYNRYVWAVREAVPDAVIVASCSGRHNINTEARREAIWAGADMASLSLGSYNHMHEVSVNAPQTIRVLAREMKENGVIPELEVFELGHIAFSHRLVVEGLIAPPYWYNVFLGNLGTLPVEQWLLEVAASMLPEGALWAGAGVGRFQWTVNRWAIEAGGHVRVGLEDSLWMDADKTGRATNVRQVERAVAFGHSLGREPGSAREALFG